MPNDTSIKTRQGYILENCTRNALMAVGISFRNGWQYSADNEIPDFTIPDSNRPKVAIEVHQTDARNSFQMKVLRAFTAVAEAKAFFGHRLLTINILFGRPGAEIPRSNINCLCSFFDCSLIINDTVGLSRAGLKIEEEALKEASKETCDVKAVADALCKKHKAFISSLGKHIQSLLTRSPKDSLFQLWKLEKARIKALRQFPPVPDRTYLKRGMLSALFIDDAVWGALIENREIPHDDLNIPYLVDKGVFIASEDLMEETLLPNGDLALFLKTDGAAKLRDLAVKALASQEDMGPFFDDIRDGERRIKMATAFLASARNGRAGLLQAIKLCHEQSAHRGIPHSRNWIADFIPLLTNDSHNLYNKRMFQHPGYKQKLGNPYNNITIKSSRLGKDPARINNYLEIAASVASDRIKEMGIDIDGIDAGELAAKLQAFRIGAAIKLQKFNPLYVIVKGLCDRFGINAEYCGQQSLLSDLSDPADPVGKYDVFILNHVTSPQKVLLCTVAAHDKHGDDKSKEWAGRRRSMLYRITDGVILQTTMRSLFVADGEWSEKDIRRLYLSGWDDVIGINALEEKLAELFGIGLTDDQ